jgi:hypothetical protein
VSPMPRPDDDQTAEEPQEIEVVVESVLEPSADVGALPETMPLTSTVEVQELDDVEERFDVDAVRSAVADLEPEEDFGARLEVDDEEEFSP